VGNLNGRAALITGGGSGIGLGAARRLAANGAHVTIAGRTEARLAGAIAEIAAEAAPGATAQYAVCDVTVEDDVVAAVARAAEPSGGLDILFACAGGSMTLGPILNAELNGWRATLDLNLVGTMLSIKHAAARMVEGGGGSIIAMSSIAGHSTHRLMSAYCVGKAGIDMLVRVAADELGEHNIRVNAVRPGLVDTDLVGFITAGGKLLDDYFEQMPVSRVGTVDDIAAMVAFLAGPDSTWITGQSIGIDGGHQLRRGPNYNLLFEQ
jgi:NAD(P)-dependent dehydrogenase (short-subunit alcohol dehydrogenase family)